MSVNITDAGASSTISTGPMEATASVAMPANSNVTYYASRYFDSQVEGSRNLFLCTSTYIQASSVCCDRLQGKAQTILSAQPNLVKKGNANPDQVLCLSHANRTYWFNCVQNVSYINNESSFRDVVAIDCVGSNAVPRIAQTGVFLGIVASLALSVVTAL